MLKIVTSSFNDAHRLYWLNELPKKIADHNVDYIVYHKDSNLKQDEIKIINERNINIPTFGSAEYSFLTHIINNYDNLDDITIFTKNNWFEQGTPFWEFLNNSVNVDFSDAGNTHRVFIYASEDCNFATPCGGVYEYVDRDKHWACECTIDWLRKIFPGQKLSQWQHTWMHGPTFSVSRRCLLRHPKWVYEYLRDRLHFDSGCFDIEVVKNRLQCNDEVAYNDVVHHLKHNFIRLWRVLFTHGLDETYKVDIAWQ